MIIKEHIMKRYTLGIVAGIICVVFFITYKKETMTASPQVILTQEKLPNKEKNLKPLTMVVNNETGKDIYVQGMFSSTQTKPGQVATASKKGPRIDIKKDEKNKTVTIQPLSGYDRLEVSFFEINGAPLRSVNSIIHRSDAPTTQQTITVK